MNKPISTTLPEEARLQLIKASQVKGELARRVAIEEAMASARANHPKLFQPVPPPEEKPCK